jgi:hypothetical protein
MKKTVLLLPSLLLAATMARAQAAPHSNFAATPGSQRSATAGQTAAAPRDSLRGCLSGSKGNFMVTDHQGIDTGGSETIRSAKCAATIYEVVGRVKQKVGTLLRLRVGRAVKGARRAFISTLDSPPDPP